MLDKTQLFLLPWAFYYYTKLCSSIKAVLDIESGGVFSWFSNKAGLKCLFDDFNKTEKKTYLIFSGCIS